METNPLDVSPIFTLIEKIANEYTPNDKEYALSEEEIKTFASIEVFKDLSKDTEVKTKVKTENSIEDKAKNDTEESHKDHQLFLVIAKQIELIATLAINSPNFEQSFFRSSSRILSHADFYNLSYYILSLSVLLDKKNKELYSAYNNELISLSLERTILDIEEHEEEDEEEETISDWTFFEQLQEMSPKEITLILEMLKTDRETKSILRKYTFKKEADNFINLISTQSINYNKAALATSQWHRVNLIKTFFSKLSKENIDFSDFKEMFKLILNEKFFLIKKKAYEMINKLFMISINPPKYIKNHSIDHHSSFVKYNLGIKNLILLHRETSHICTNFEAVQQVNILISTWEYTKSLEKNMLYGDIALTDTYDCKALEMFKNKFIRELNIPESVGRAKDEKYYYCKSAKKEELSEEKYFNLYKALANEGLLKWDEEVAFSFLYRMCENYKPQRNDPSQIIWQGDTRELISLIWKYHEDTTRIWAKTKKFFLDSEGQVPKTNGAKNQIVPTERMKKIFDSIK